MRQLIQSLRTGELEILDVPAPRARPGFVRVANLASIVSPGTERQITELASKSMAGKARARPDLVRKVLDKVQRDGVRAAYRSVQAKLSEPAPVGYSCAGEIVEVGAGAERFAPGMLVACAGAGFASHAEEVLVPKNLVVPVPSGVMPEHAAFATLGAIALHGVRTLQPEIGEQVLVVGLGLLGQLSVQLLKAAGCSVFGVDLSAERIELAKRLGAQAGWQAHDADVAQRVLDATDGRGADAVLITASSSNNAPMELAGDAARDRGRVIVVGSIRTEFDRNRYYMKELDVRLSRSYGPGRYDNDFELKGHTYPPSYVRFTETENLRCVLELIARGTLDVDALISHRFAFEQALDAYSLLTKTPDAAMGIVLHYSAQAERAHRRHSDIVPALKTGTRPRRVLVGQKPRVSFIGAGAFARSVLLPLVTPKARLALVATGRGLTAQATADRFAFERAAAGIDDVLNDQETDVVFVATQHASHAALVGRALDAQKHVFCEKPLAITEDGLRRVELALRDNPGLLLHVGFNRRFSPMARSLQALRAQTKEPANVLIRVNAGSLPADHWTRDPEIGGGRIVGEGCHFVDLARFIVGAPISSLHVTGAQGSEQVDPLENFHATLSFVDGSICSIIYSAMGDTGLGKERVELFVGGAAGVIDDFARLSIVRSGTTRTTRALSKDKGHGAQVQAFFAALIEAEPIAPIDPTELLEVSWATLALRESLRRHEPVDLAEFMQHSARSNDAEVDLGEMLSVQSMVGRGA